MRATVSVLIRPLPLIRARRARRAIRRIPAREVRSLFAPRGTRLRRYGESARERLTDIGRRDDATITDDRGLLRRLVTQPALALVLALLIVSLVAERHVPDGDAARRHVAAGAASAERSVAARTRPAGTTPGSAARQTRRPIWRSSRWSARCCLAAHSLRSRCCCSAACRSPASRPTSRRVRSSTTNRLRVWLAATYALLPVATGSIASGRLGTAVAFAVLPLVLLLVGQSLLPQLYTNARIGALQRHDGPDVEWLACGPHGRPPSCWPSGPRSIRCCTCCWCRCSRWR